MRVSHFSLQAGAFRGVGKHARTRFTRFTNAKRSSVRNFLTNQYTSASFPHTTPNSRTATIQRLHSLQRVSTGNLMFVYSDSAEAFEEMWAAVDNAKKTVRWQTYIMKNDKVGQITVQKLLDAKKRGVDVELLYDDAGNITGRGDLVGKLREAGANVICYKPFLTYFIAYFRTKMSWKYSPAIRNHRKILIVDGEVGFAGGLNVGNDYAGPRVGGDGRFRDTQCKIIGPAVKHLQEVYDDTLAGMQKKTERRKRFKLWRRWAYASMQSKIPKINLELTQEGKPAEKGHWTEKGHWAMKDTKEQVNGSLANVKDSFLLAEGEPTVQILMCNPYNRDWSIQRAMWLVVRKSVKSVWITTPYFLPTRKLMKAVLYAARRGVDVRILAGSMKTTDPPFMWWVSQAVVRQLLDAGVKLYEYDGGAVMHAKTLVVDGVWCSVGSYNWDILSNKLLEVCVTTLDSNTATTVEAQFLVDLANSRKITGDEFIQRSIVMRSICRLAYFFLRCVERFSFWDYADPELTSRLD